MGQMKRGLLYVLFFWTGIPYLLCIVDLLRFIFMTDEAFNLQYNENINEMFSNKELDDDRQKEVYSNRFDNAVDAEYSYVDKNGVGDNNENNIDSGDELITKAFQYYDSINNAEKSLNDYEFAANVKQLNILFKCVIDKVKDDSKDGRARKELEKMLEYNIPTILKLINAYIDLSSSKIVDTNNIKSDIKESVLAVIQYLKNVIDNIQKDDIMDITSDIDVLKNTLRKGGYI